jgi:ketosteroid isomerase-like protein
METMKKVLNTKEIASRFDELARQEKWFEIQEELFADDVKSVEPPNSPYLKNVEGKNAVRKKGQDWVSKIEEVHTLSTTQPILGGNHFAVGRIMDITVKGLGRVKMNEIMLYEVRDGQIIKEQFFY